MKNVGEIFQLGLNLTNTKMELGKKEGEMEGF